jgi:HTH-type transcriptional regulator/antitoxin HigA
LIELLPYNKHTSKPIRNEVDYETALRQIEKVMEAKFGTPEYDLLEVLSLLIGDYEDRTYTFDLPDPIEAIKYTMEEEGLNQSDLGNFVGGKAMASLILNKKRKMSLNVIRVLSKELKIPLEVLIQEYELFR